MNCLFHINIMTTLLCDRSNLFILTTLHFNIFKIPYLVKLNIIRLNLKYQIFLAPVILFLGIYPEYVGTDT